MMKKRLPILLAPFVLLSMVSCGPTPKSDPVTSVPPTPPSTSVVPPTSAPVPPSTPVTPPSTSIPVPPTSIPVPPTSIPTPPGPDTSTGPVIPLSPQEMHAAVRDAALLAPVEFVGKVVGIEQYSSNTTSVNLFMQNEVFGFRVNNAPLGSAVVGKTYKVKAGSLGSSKKYVGVNYNTKNLPGSIEEVEAVNSEPIAWNSNLNAIETVSTAVKATGRIQKKEEYKLTVKVGSDLLEISSQAAVTAGAPVKEKFAEAKVGHEISFVGFPYTNENLKLISILDPALVTYGDAIKEPLPGTITRDVSVGGDKLSAEVEGEKITFSGVVAYDEESQANLVGFEIHKNTALSSFDEIKLCSTTTCNSAEDWSDKAALVEAGILFEADSFKLSLPYDQISDDKTIEVRISWSSIVSDQVFTIASKDLTKGDAYTKTYIGTIQGDPNSTLGGNATGSLSAENPIKVVKSDDGKIITFGDSGYEIAYYQADESLGRTAGNRVGVQINKPGDLADLSATTVRINEGEPLVWNDISDDPESKSYFWFYPLIKDVTVENKVTISWSADSAPQVFTIKIAEGTLLQKDPNAPAIATHHYDIDEDFVYNSNVSQALSSISADELGKGISGGEHIISSVSALNKVFSTSATYKHGQVLKFASGSATGSLTFGLTKNVTQVKVKWMTWSGKKTSLTVNGVNKEDTSTGAATGTTHEFTFDIESSNSINFATASGYTGFLLAIEFIG